MKTTPLANLVPGMTVATDVYLPNGRLLFSRGLVLNDSIITRLEFYSIPRIEVEDNDAIAEAFPLPAESPDKELFSHRLKRNPRFKVFLNQYIGQVDVLREQFDSILKTNEQPDVDSLKENVRIMFRSCTQMGGIMNILSNMRRMSDETYAHSMNVSLICNAFAGWLGLSAERRDILSLAGLFHDIGKTKVSSEILHKPDTLTVPEMETVRSHTTMGYAMLKDLDLDEKIKQAALLHHERIDGSGYPFGYKGKNIDFFAQIVSIADVYEAMTSPRIYRGALCPFKAIETFEYDGYQKFDAKLMLTFLEYVINTYLSMRVRLTDGRVGEIIYINPTDIGRPVINCDGTAVDLSRNRQIKVDSIVA